jgi:hypothetical protein
MQLTEIKHARDMNDAERSAVLSRLKRELPPDPPPPVERPKLKYTMSEDDAFAQYEQDKQRWAGLSSGKSARDLPPDQRAAILAEIKKGPPLPPLRLPAHARDMNDAARQEWLNEYRRRLAR